MNYQPEFIDLVELCQPVYIGTGNPTSKIVIIGKECAINQVNDQNQYRQEIALNSTDWLANVTNETNANEVDDWFQISNPLYNPLYPYKHQLFKKRSETNGVVRGEGGTSTTWYNYQKLINHIISPKQSEYIDFHEKTFVTEMNQITGRYSREVPEIVRLNSIKKRLTILKHPFFQQFPIVIVACGHYVRDYQIDLEALFDVKWNSPTIDIAGNWINVHYAHKADKPKLLIHTNQLSMGITNELLERIAFLCNEFIISNNIHL